MEHTKQLGEAKISKLLIKFSVPAVVGMMVNALYNVVDRIFVGHGVGFQGLAGITICFPIMLVMMAFGMLIGLGATALVSIRLGEQKFKEAEQILGNAMTLIVFLSVTLALFGLGFMDTLLRWCGASEAILPVARDYLRIILWGSVFQQIGFGMNNLIRAEGNPKIAMFTMLIGAALNTILDPVFIFVLDMGVAGAAWATIISQLVSAVWVLWYYLGGQSSLKLHLRNLKLHGEIVGKILALGSAPFAMQIAASAINIVLNNSLVKYGGDMSVSAMGIVHSFITLLIMPVFGINQGSQPIIGYNYGARKFDRVKRTLKLAVMVATVITSTGYIITRVFPEQVVSLFSSGDPELLQLATRALFINMFFMPVIGFQIVSSNYFQAVGKPKHAMFLSLSRQVVLLIPALLILPRYFGLDGVFMAGPAGDLGSSILTGFWIWFEMKRLDAKHQRMQIG